MNINKQAQTKCPYGQHVNSPELVDMLSRYHTEQANNRTTKNY